MQPIELFVFPTSPYAMKVACYLAYQQRDYQAIGVSPISFEQVAFTGRRQVPVLKIGNEWKQDSHDIGLWLEEKFPGSQLLGNSETERASIIDLDQWISNQVIPGAFRLVVDWPSISIGLRNGWKLAAAVNRSTPIPFWVQWMWPVFLRKAKFILAMMDNLDRSQSLEQAQKNTVEEFIRRLAGGTFLGGRDQPSLADLSAFPVIVFSWRFGLQGEECWVSSPAVRAWIEAVQQYLPDNPFLVSTDQLPRALP